MRVTGASITSRLMQQVQDSRRALADVQQRTGSGLRINTPSDDPTATGRVMALQSDVGLNDQYQRNSGVALSDLAVNEASLSSLSDVLQRARELAVQAANGSIGAPERQNIALEVSQLITQAVSIGNTKINGRYIFAGQKTGTVPFVPDSANNPSVVAYTGDTNNIDREISKGDRLATNITGDHVFPGVFADLIAFRDHLLSNNVGGLGTDGDHAASRLDQALELRSEVGAKMNRVDAGLTRLKDEHTMMEGLVSTEQDADLAQSIVDMQARETTLQAALGAAGRALNLSLLEFLR
jgi:flagellar hook-associated protein 3 FlgL